MDFGLIDEFRRRTNASYDHAKYYLEMANGDLLDAVIAYEREKTGFGQDNTHRRVNRGGGLLNGIIKVVQRLIDVKLSVTDTRGGIFNIPLLVILLLGFAWPIIAILGIGMLILGYRFRFIEISDPNINVAAFVEKIRSKARENN